MANTDFSAVNGRMQNDPGYRAALAGESNLWNYPTGPDGKVLPGFRVENARAYADKALGRQNVPSGAINSKGEFYDPNADHWYSDPRVLGPVAVGVASAGLGMLGAPAAAAPVAASAAPTAAGVAAPAAATTTTAATTAATGAQTMGVLDWVKKGLGLAQDVAPVLSNAAQGSANQRTNENAAQDRAYNNQLQAARFNQGERDSALKRQLLMSLLGGSLSPVNVTPGNPAIATKMGTMSGGYGSLNKDALMQVLGAVSPMSAPTAPTAQGQGMGEKVLGGSGLALSLLGALKQKNGGQ